MRAVRSLLIAATLALTCQTSGSALAGKYTEYGEGTVSCGTYVQAAERQRISGSSVRYLQFTGFTNGYLTALNWMASAVGVQDGTYKNIMQGTDLEGQMLWLENYCRQHPLSDFGVAVSELVIVLTKQGNK
jgi:hypothetical protein